MTRIFRYILQHDTGMAPCIDRGLLSLATCKPKIRAGARVGEWVIGFRPSPAPRGLVVWAGRVAQSLEVGDYERKYRGRSDAVYRAKVGGGFIHLRQDYHSDKDEFKKDTSAPVLIFELGRTWYFGCDPEMLPNHLIHLAAGGQGHRVNGVNDADADTLEEWLLSIGRPAGVSGVPRDGSSARPLSRC